jgi:hypothetical protein
MKNPVSAPPPADARLAELVNAVRTGNSNALEELHDLLAPGVRFLIRRRLTGGGAEPHVRSVLDAAVRAIREDPAMASGNVARLVRQLIVRRFPVRLKESNQDPRGSGTKAAERILKRMSSVERDALRRCYVLGEAPESFLRELKLTPDQFQALQCRARAEFSAKGPPTANVA